MIDTKIDNLNIGWMDRNQKSWRVLFQLHRIFKDNDDKGTKKHLIDFLGYLSDECTA